MGIYEDQPLARAVVAIYEEHPLSTIYHVFTSEYLMIEIVLFIDLIYIEWSITPPKVSW